MRVDGLCFQHEFQGLLFLYLCWLFLFSCYLLFLAVNLNYCVKVIDCFAELIDPSLKKTLKPSKNFVNSLAEV